MQCEILSYFKLETFWSTALILIDSSLDTSKVMSHSSAKRKPSQASNQGRHSEKFQTSLWAGIYHFMLQKICVDYNVFDIFQKRIIYFEDLICFLFSSFFFITVRNECYEFH